jgi:hypothetical protein
MSGCVFCSQTRSRSKRVRTELTFQVAIFIRAMSPCGGYRRRQVRGRKNDFTAMGARKQGPACFQGAGHSPSRTGPRTPFSTRTPAVFGGTCASFRVQGQGDEVDEHFAGCDTQTSNILKERPTSPQSLPGKKGTP